MRAQRRLWRMKRARRKAAARFSRPEGPGNRFAATRARDISESCRSSPPHPSASLTPSPQGEGKAIFVTFSHSPGLVCCRFRGTGRRGRRPLRWKLPSRPIHPNSGGGRCLRFPPPFRVLVFPFFSPAVFLFLPLSQGVCNVFINIFPAFLHRKNPGDILSH